MGRDGATGSANRFTGQSDPDFSRTLSDRIHVGSSRANRRNGILGSGLGVAVGVADGRSPAVTTILVAVPFMISTWIIGYLAGKWLAEYMNKKDGYDE
jgi:hypothetical protein